MDDESMSEGLVAWLREQDALEVGTDDPRFADTDLLDLDDEASLTGEFDVETALAMDLPALTPLRSITWDTLFDATTDVLAAEYLCLVADLDIIYSGGRCAFRCTWYEVPPGIHAPPPPPAVELAVEPVAGAMVVVHAHPDRAEYDRMTATVADVLR
jgi:hypothetical protein